MLRGFTRSTVVAGGNESGHSSNIIPDRQKCLCYPAIHNTHVLCHLRAYFAIRNNNKPGGRGGGGRTASVGVCAGTLVCWTIVSKAGSELEATPARGSNHGLRERTKMLIPRRYCPTCTRGSGLHRNKQNPRQINMLSVLKQPNRLALFGCDPLCTFRTCYSRDGGSPLFDDDCHR